VMRRLSAPRHAFSSLPRSFLSLITKLASYVHNEVVPFAVL
jgi:hypothetical protein